MIEAYVPTGMASRRERPVGSRSSRFASLRQEFPHVDDSEGSTIFLMRKLSSPKIVRVSSVAEITIGGLAPVVRDVVGLVHDPTRPDGTARAYERFRRLESAI